VQTAVTMRQVTGSMANVVRGMDSAMKSMDLEKVHTHTIHIQRLAKSSLVTRRRRHADTGGHRSQQ